MRFKLCFVLFDWIYSFWSHCEYHRAPRKIKLMVFWVIYSFAFNFNQKCKDFFHFRLKHQFHHNQNTVEVLQSMSTLKISKVFGHYHLQHTTKRMKNKRNLCVYVYTWSCFECILGLICVPFQLLKSLLQLKRKKIAEIRYKLIHNYSNSSTLFFSFAYWKQCQNYKMSNTANATLFVHSKCLKCKQMKIFKDLNDFICSFLLNIPSKFDINSVFENIIEEIVKFYLKFQKKNKTKHMTKRAFVGTFVRLGTIFCYHYTRFINKLVLGMLWNRWTSKDTQNHQKNVVKTTKKSTKQEFKRRNNQERFMRKNYRMIENLSSATKLA